MSGGDHLDFLDELRSDGAPSAGEGLKPSFQRESDAFEQASVGHIGERMTVQNSMKIGVELQSARDLSQPSEENRGPRGLCIRGQVLRVTGIADEGVGVIVVLRMPEPPRELVARINALQESEVPTAQEKAPELRTYGIGAQILTDLGVRKMRVLSAPKRMQAISGFGLEVVEYVSCD